MDFPKWVFFPADPTRSAQLVQTPADQAALGEGWSETPTGLPDLGPAPVSNNVAASGSSSPLEYPKVLYRAVEGGKAEARTVASAGEERALGDGWSETPTAPVQVLSPFTPSIEALDEALSPVKAETSKRAETPKSAEKPVKAEKSAKPGA